MTPDDDKRDGTSVPLQAKVELRKPGPAKVLRMPSGALLDADDVAEFYASLRDFAAKVKAGSRGAAVALAGLLRAPPADVPLPPDVLGVLADVLEKKIRFKAGKPGPKSRLPFYRRRDPEVLELVARKQAGLRARGLLGETDQKAAIEAVASDLHDHPLPVGRLSRNEIDQILHPRKPRKSKK